MGLTLALQLSDVHRDSDWFQWTEEEDAELCFPSGTLQLQMRKPDGAHASLCRKIYPGGRAPGTFHRLHNSSNYDENQERLQFPILRALITIKY